MTEKEKRKFILGFIKRHKICVLSTVSPDNRPESAVIEFGETDNLELIFDTFMTYRKYKNILNNHNVSVVIGWDEDRTVQYEGVAVELNMLDTIKYQKLYVAKNPSVAKFMVMPGIRCFKITPKWIRYTDVGVFPYKIIELDLNFDILTFSRM